MNSTPTKLFFVCHLAFDVMLVLLGAHDVLWVNYPQQVTLERRDPFAFMIFGLGMIVLMVIGQAYEERQ